MLSPSEQWTLHAYFEFTKKLTDTELLAHRQSVSLISPSLPQRAGRAYARFRLFSERIPDYVDRRSQAPKRRKGATMQLAVLSEVHPTPNVAGLVEALIQHQRELAARTRPDLDPSLAERVGDGHGAEAETPGDRSE